MSEVLPNYILDKIISIPISNNDMKDKVTWKFTSNWTFSAKQTTWANNGNIFLHAKARLLNYISKLKLLHKIKTYYMEACYRKNCY